MMMFFFVFLLDIVNTQHCRGFRDREWQWHSEPARRLHRCTCLSQLGWQRLASECCTTSTSGAARERKSHSVPHLYRANTALAGKGARPLPSPHRGGGWPGAEHTSPLWSQPNIGGVAAGPAGPRARRAARGRRKASGKRAGPAGLREAKWRGREPRAGQGPGGGAARVRGGAKTTAATVVEGREPGIRAEPTGHEKRSDEARAVCRGDPRRRRRALAERSVDGPAREGQNELEERSCKESVQRAKRDTGWGRGVSKALR
jgi:hypothetical protein